MLIWIYKPLVILPLLRITTCVLRVIRIIGLEQTERKLLLINDLRRINEFHSIEALFLLLEALIKKFKRAVAPYSKVYFLHCLIHTVELRKSKPSNGDRLVYSRRLPSNKQTF